MNRSQDLRVRMFVGVVIVVVTLLLGPGLSIFAQSPGFSEDCISFDPNLAEVRRYSGSWKIVIGNLWLMDFGTQKNEAEKAFKIILAYGFTNICYVGRPRSVMTYFRSDQGTVGTPGSQGTPSSTATLSGLIVMYGRQSCGLCKRMMQSLDQAKISYIFYDVDQDSERKQEMWIHVTRYSPGIRSVTFPVMVVNGQVMISPSFEEVKKQVASGPIQPSTYTAPPIQNGGSSWDESMYRHYDQRTFFNFSAAKQRIDLNAIDYSLLQAALFYETNRVRVNSNRSVLAYNPGCAGAAQMHARDMAEGKFFDHENPNDPSKKKLRDRIDLFGIRWSWIGENINRGEGNGSYIDVARKYVDSWMHSMGHQANILSVKATHMGTGAYNAGSKWSGLYFMAAQVFVQVTR